MREVYDHFFAVEFRGRWHLTSWHGSVMTLNDNPESATCLSRSAWEQEAHQAHMRQRRAGMPGRMQVSAWKVVPRDRAIEWAILPNRSEIEP